jgi:hypothetical protein
MVSMSLFLRYIALCLTLATNFFIIRTEDHDVLGFGALYVPTQVDANMSGQTYC